MPEQSTRKFAAFKRIESRWTGHAPAEGLAGLESLLARISHAWSSKRPFDLA